MGREVRRVPKSWKHQKDPRGQYVPLLDGYDTQREDWEKAYREEGLQAALDQVGPPPDKNDYMPEWPDAKRTHLMMYETCTEGTPISPAFATPEELARWLTDNKASAFADMTCTYQQWLGMIRGPGYSVGSAVLEPGRCRSGVESSVKPGPSK